jgi:hypothetical protein
MEMHGSVRHALVDTDDAGDGEGECAAMGVRLRSQGGTKMISLIKLDFGEVQRLSQGLEKGTAPCGRVAQGKVPRLQIDNHEPPYVRETN